VDKNKVIKPHRDQMHSKKKKKKKRKHRGVWPLGVVQPTLKKKINNNNNKIKSICCRWSFLDMRFRFIVLLVDGRCDPEFSS